MLIQSRAMTDLRRKRLESGFMMSMASVGSCIGFVLRALRMPRKSHKASRNGTRGPQLKVCCIMSDARIERLSDCEPTGLEKLPVRQFRTYTSPRLTVG